VIIQPMAGRCSYGTGELYEKHGSYYARWRTSDGRKLNPEVGPVRPPGTSDGLTRSQAERTFRKMQEAEEKRPSRRRGVEPITASAAATSLRRAKSLEGTRKSYLENLESIQRVHVDPSIGSMPLEKVSTGRIETLASGLLSSGRSPKTVRNLLTFLYSVFEHAIANGWCHENPVRRAARIQRRRRPRVRPPADRATDRPQQGHQALSGGLPRGRGTGDHVPQPETHVRHPARPRTASRCGPSRNTSATPMRRPLRSTRTMRLRRTRWPGSTPPSPTRH
jgi:hypothetical protein